MWISGTIDKIFMLFIGDFLQWFNLFQIIRRKLQWNIMLIATDRRTAVFSFKNKINGFHIFKVYAVGNRRKKYNPLKYACAATRHWNILTLINSRAESGWGIMKILEYFLLFYFMCGMYKKQSKLNDIAENIHLKFYFLNFWMLFTLPDVIFSWWLY